jgi:hypothetical protein
MESSRQCLEIVLSSKIGIQRIDILSPIAMISSAIGSVFFKVLNNW